MISPKKVAENIENKVLKKMSKAELSRKLDITPQSVQGNLDNWKEGKSFRLSTIQKIADVAGISCEELLTQN